jgi:serine protease Do
MPIIERIRNQTPRPLLGIQGSNMTETISRAFNLPMMGVIVESVFEGSGAYLAGIRQSDIITSFAGYPVLNMENLSGLVQSHNIGDTVEVTILRDGREVIEMSVTLLENIHTSF